MRSSRGFTLLEMMVATVILAVVVVGVMVGISGALRNASRLTSYDRAVQLARDGGLTLIGFLRDRRFIVYAHPRRCRAPLMLRAHV